MIALLTFTLLISFSLQAEKICSKYSCTDLAEGTCSHKEVTDTVQWNLHECSDFTKPYCPFKQEGEKDAQCEENKIAAEFSGFGGSDCSTNDDCNEGLLCSGDPKKCQGKVATTECANTGECNIGLVCIQIAPATTKTCQAPVAGYACTDSSECDNNSVCAIVDASLNKCIELFSIADGQQEQKIQGQTFSEIEYLSTCASGFASTDGICRTLELKEESLKACTEDTDCKYTYLYGEEKAEASVENSCQCGFNATGEKKCLLTNTRNGSEEAYNSFKTGLKDNLTANKAKCHSYERFKCKDTYFNGKPSFNKLQTKAIDSHNPLAFDSADSCVKAIVNPFYAPARCPAMIFSEEQSDDCGVALNILSEHRTVTLHECKTKDTVCTFNPTKFASDEIYTAKCETPSAPSGIYPGEACKNKEDCRAVSIWDDKEKKFVKNNDCVNNKCTGAAPDARCESDESCVAGNYCLINKTEADKQVCKPQLQADAVCKSSYDCVNNTFCLKDAEDEKKNKCVAVLSLKIGTDISSFNVADKGIACETNFYTKDKDGKERCAQSKYSTGSTPDEVGVIKCGYEEKCSYQGIFSTTDAKDTTTFTQDCVCGYNKTGQGYCPYSRHDTSTLNRFNKFKEILTSNLNNSLHTLNRNSGSSDSIRSPACYPYFENSAYAHADEVISDFLSKGVCEDIDPHETSTTSTTSEDTSEEDTSSSTSFYSVSLFLLALLAMMI